MTTESIVVKQSSLEKKDRSDPVSSEDFVRALIRSACTGIYIIQKGRFIYVNSLFQEMTGYSERELVNSGALNLVHPEDRDMVRQNAIENLKAIEYPQSYEYRFVKKNGEIMWVLERVTSTEYNGALATVGSFMDITERKLAEEELKTGLKQLRKAMEGSVQAMALMVESRDPYTAGHQKRVTQLACAIAAEMGLSENQIDGIRMAASTHDIGKIRIPADILSKPGKLEEIEAMIVKAHPQVGYDVLKEIDFPYPVAEAVLQHHERINGSGYPAGLKGNEIIIEAKILAVSDVVEAMASHRPYRPAIGIQEALQEISQNRGILYDPDVVDKCVQLFQDKGFKMK
jgi:PAS domain S-box-containing protein/putative nucleotidyltransferase with HDIG domain